MRSTRFEKFQRRVQPIINHVLYPPARVLLHARFHITFEGKENLPPRGPYLVAAKQNTNYDPFLAAMGLWQVGIHTRFIMRDLYLPPVVRELSLFLLSWLGARRILREREIRRARRKQTRRRRLRDARERIHGSGGYLAIEAEDGGCLFFFPEGTRSMRNMRPFRREFFEVAVALARNIQLIPVGIEYADSNRVTIRYGRAIPCNGDVGVLIDRCYDEIRRLSGL